MRKSLAMTCRCASALAVCLCLVPAAVDAAACESLSTVALSNTKILSTSVQPAGAFTPPGAPSNAAPNPALANLPAFCRVTASLHPTSDSDIRIEVWIPASNWNGKLDGRQDRSYTAALRIPRGRALHGDGEHGRRRELRVSHATRKRRLRR